MRKLFIAMGLIVALLGVTSIQSFAEDNVIYGCIDKTGKLRIVSDPNGCNLKKETSIPWNQTGLQGPPGEPGEPGPAGEDGLACWDLDANGTCDLATEDKNDDGECDARDCQGEPGPLNVYSAKDEFLGMLVDLALVDNCKVYIPTREKVLSIRLQRHPVDQGINDNFGGYLWYEEDNCGGTPYIRDSRPALHHFILTHDDEFGVPHNYTMSFDKYNCQFRSRQWHGDPCEEYVAADPDAQQLTEIDLPFDYPIVTPLVFK